MNLGADSVNLGSDPVNRESDPVNLGSDPRKIKKQLRHVINTSLVRESRNDWICK